MKELIKEISKKTKLSEKEVSDIIGIPPEGLGDYAFPCFILSKKLKKNPSEIAKELAEKLNLRNFEVKPVNAYVNFFVNKNKLAEKILKTKKKSAKKGKILVEHTSINPNASPHMGRIRNSLIGDSIVRLLKYQGYNTETHYYVNDVSKQIAMLALVCKGNEKFEDLLKKYKEISKKIEKNKKLENQVFDLLSKFESGNSETRKKFNKIVDIAIKGQKNLLSQLGIKFDFFDYESDFLKDQEKIIKQLEKKGLKRDKYNRTYLEQPNLKKMMKDPVFVLTRSDGTGLYPLRDIAYTIKKMKKGKNIIVLGEDQKLYFKQLKQALKSLNKEAPIPIHYSFVLIQDKGIIKKMATRKGDFVLLEDFLKEAIKKASEKSKDKKIAEKVALSAIKYSILKKDPNKNIIFNLDESLSFEGNTGPYLLYSYARASSLLKKAKSKTKPKIEKITEIEFKLLKKIDEFPKIIEKAEQQLNPALVAHYSYQLSQIFNEFYHSEKIIGNKRQAFKLAIVKKFRETLKDSLSLLGISVLEKM